MKKHKSVSERVFEGVLRDLRKIHESKMGFVEEEKDELEENIGGDTGSAFGGGYDAPAFAADKETSDRKNILTKQAWQIGESNVDEEYIKENIIRPIILKHLKKF